jgi:DNA-binding response OmpR family regulator
VNDRAAGGLAHILVVEDEPSIRQGLCDVLTFRGYAVDSSGGGSEGLAKAEQGQFDLIVLDIMLPELDGLSVCRSLRSAGREVPVLMLTAKGDEQDVLNGFEAGADDYVTKPFSVREFLARVQALLKRNSRLTTAAFRAGPFEVLPERGCARSSRTEVELSAREIAILRLLAHDPGRIISRRTLLRDAWGMSNAGAVETRTVDVHIAKLRKKLGPEAAQLLETVRGQGYRWCDSSH